MREIKFRGQNSAGWRIGSLIVNPLYTAIIEIEDPDDGTSVRHYVMPETVGQYTGLKDSEGREIYEEDIVKATLKDKSFVKRFHMDGTITGKISFDGAWWLGEWGALWRLPRYYDLTVIGNVHDSPELLEGKDA